ncbi:hypothetical protein VC83_05451 [Pseudogymnoascus destructans]|uniref:Uncharacterized protein n=2 Tax=Pseudogymnoascus destructans TaxID=655981 RepID=L8G3T9_PSED2|nr:uncharacterized protein VC83_05451 [Pseudogymnoascus destructans]ELR06586.1 hypothetical protein GMDG_08059 [Pseudogymnoascus destructans 20631-21]OAF58176.1 hypothetical protein VC83_05451 [Pseudogymnoascus destructans]
MRHFADMPKEPVKEDRVMQPAAIADRAVLRRFADLADQLGFTSPRIKHLQQYPTALAEQTPPSEHPPLVTSGSGVGIAHRCGTPLRPKFNEDRKFWFINHLHDEREQQGNAITNFFVRKQIYLAFFGWPTWRPTAQGGSHGRSPSLCPVPDFGDLPRDPSPDAQQHMVGSRTDQTLPPPYRTKHIRTCIPKNRPPACVISAPKKHGISTWVADAHLISLHFLLPSFLLCSTTSRLHLREAFSGHFRGRDGLCLLASGIL